MHQHGARGVGGGGCRQDHEDEEAINATAHVIAASKKAQTASQRSLYSRKKVIIFIWSTSY